MKTVLSLLLLTVLIGGGFASANIVPSGMAQSPQTVNGIIASNTIWTKTNSPYNLTGPVLVKDSVTLTIEPGATVNLNDYYIQVNGTLIAQGTKTNPIEFNYGLIKFTQFSNGWNGQASSGSIIENANLALIDIQSAAPKISNCSIVKIVISGSPVICDNAISDGVDIRGGSPLIEKNTINGNIAIQGSPTLLGNTVITPSNQSAITINGGSPLIANNTIMGGGLNGVSSFYWWKLPAIYLLGGSVSIVNNTISGNDLSGFGRNRSDSIYSDAQSVEISNNYITGGLVVNNRQSQIRGNVVYGTITARGPAVIFNNTIMWIDYGITAGGQSHDLCVIANNRLYGGGNSTGAGILLNGAATVENNYITVGIYVSAPANVVIRNNTISKGALGSIGPYYAIGGGVYGSITAQSTVIFNNLDGGIYLASSENVNASYNWWGTTDAQAINNSIHDFKNDFNVGVVNFAPFLLTPHASKPHLAGSGCSTLLRSH